MAGKIVSLLFSIHLFFVGCPVVLCRLLDFLDDFDAIPFDKSSDACKHNSDLLARVLSQNASNNVLRFPFNHTFHLHHGIVASGVNNSVIQLDGTLRFEKSELPNEKLEKKYLACVTIEKTRNLTITSNHRGVVDGRGSQVSCGLLL